MDPDEFLEYRIVRLGSALERRFSNATAKHGLSAREFSVLAALAAHPQITGSELARTVLTSPQAMSVIVDKLEIRGLLERPPARGRGRAAPVALTRPGLDVLEMAGRDVRELERVSSATLDPADREALKRAVAALEKLLDAPPRA